MIPSPVSHTPQPEWHPPRSLFRSITYHTRLTLVKCVALPLELGVLTIAESCKLISKLFCRKVATNRPKISDHLTAVCDELKKVVEITIKYGIAKKGEELHALDGPQGPKFVCIQPENSSGNPPILYAPGYLDSPQTLRSTCRRIAKEHGAPVYILQYRSLFQSLDEHAKDVASLATRIQADTNCDSIVLIGHSMGGLSTGKFIENAPTIKIAYWMTIASPLHGTKIARLGIGKCAKEMRPHSLWLENFQKNSRALKETPSLHICTKTDHIVLDTPPLDDPTTFVCPETRGHIGVRECTLIEKKIIDTLKKAAPAA